MKLPRFLYPVFLGVLLSGCKSKVSETGAPPATGNPDIPILKATPGDFWKYKVSVEMPPGAVAGHPGGITTNYERIRTYLGKIPFTKDAPAVDCFEVTAPDSPPDREFVNILEDRIELRGELKMKDSESRPIVFPKPVVFVRAGLQAGDTLEIPAMTLGNGGAARQRTSAVIGREDCQVPAGTFTSIRMVMGGLDGQVETRRTLWFAPGTGIVKEERVRYAAGKVVVREIHELTEKGSRPLSRAGGKE